MTGQEGDGEWWEQWRDEHRGVPLVRLSDTQQVQWLVGVDSVEGLPLPTSRSGGIRALLDCFASPLGHGVSY